MKFAKKPVEEPQPRTVKETVLEYLKTQDKVQTPTEIGKALGKPRGSLSNALKVLVKEGVVIRGVYDNKVLYRAI
jgi:DNA-binding IclR family transcriptional regulator